MQKGDSLELRISDISRSGPGVGRTPESQVVFVPFTAPGDLVLVEIVKEEKRYLEGRVKELREASSLRTEAPCPAFTRCGGCEWQHLPYELQWKAKKSGLLHALQRVQVNHDLPWEEYPAERIWEYRNRVQLRGFENEIGFYARGSKRIVPIEKCWIARPEINALIPKLREDGKTRPRPYKVEVETFDDGSTQVAWNERHAAGGFRQVHDEQNEKLRGWVKKHLTKGRPTIDLYGGRGNLTLALAPQQVEIHCVDIGSYPENPPGTPKNYFFHAEDAHSWIKARARSFEGAKQAPTSLVLDPPREGLAENFLPVVEAFHALNVQEILAIGCDADNWARDMARLTRHGWKIESLGALDLFPQTHHIEALAVLRKKD